MRLQTRFLKASGVFLIAALGAHSAKATSTTYTYTGEVVDWTVDVTGTYDITVYGAEGGGNSDEGGTGGLGAAIGGEVLLTIGEELGIVVGGEGGAGNVNGQEDGGGGGGGSFVYVLNASQPLIVAGGGGGGSLGYNGGSAQTGTSGAAGDGCPNGGGAGGTGGNGGGVCSSAPGAGGGGGWLSNGANGTSGGDGGDGPSSFSGGSGYGDAGNGGFGGGGGAGESGGGGGGGYSGGGGAGGYYFGGNGGGGGGSFIAAMFTDTTFNAPAITPGNGEVVIASVAPEPSCLVLVCGAVWLLALTKRRLAVDVNAKPAAPSDSPFL